MLCKHLVRLKKSEEGGVIILVTVAILVLVAAAGVAFDMSRMQTAKAKLSNCLDTAGLAALSKVAVTPSGVSVNDWVVQNVKKYFLADCQSGYLETANVTFNGQNQKNNVSVSLSKDYDTLTLDAIVTQNTSLMPIIGVPQVTISAHSVASRTTSGLELALVLDNTGSMGDAVASDDPVSKIKALKCALAGDAGIGVSSNFCDKDKNLVTFGLLDILFGGLDSRPNLFVGLITFTDMVNIGTGVVPGSGFIDNRGASGISNCVSARSGTKKVSTNPSLTLDISDDPPRTKDTFFTALKNSDVIASDGSNYCPAAFQNMTVSKSALISQIRKMTPNGNTFIHLGFAWGWRMLSPNWSGLWGDTPIYTIPNTTTTMQVPLPYHTQGMTKVTVLMTDGVNTVPWGNPNAYMNQGDMPTSTDQLNTLTRSVCDAMKAKGIIIYTIGFGPTSGPDKIDADLLNYCASNDQPGQHFFQAASNQALSNAFQQIGGQLSNLLITQ